MGLYREISLLSVRALPAYLAHATREEEGSLLVLHQAEEVAATHHYSAIGGQQAREAGILLCFFVWGITWTTLHTHQYPQPLVCQKTLAFRMSPCALQPRIAAC